jgi:hypothetical protein
MLGPVNVLYFLLAALKYHASNAYNGSIELDLQVSASLISQSDGDTKTISMCSLWKNGVGNLQLDAELRLLAQKSIPGFLLLQA